MSAEINLRRGTSGRSWSASMGPRSCERGNCTVETSRPRTSACFNGAALKRARRLRPEKIRPSGNHIASMGPRSRERRDGSSVRCSYGKGELADCGVMFVPRPTLSAARSITLVHIGVCPRVNRSTSASASLATTSPLARHTLECQRTLRPMAHRRGLLDYCSCASGFKYGRPSE